MFFANEMGIFGVDLHKINLDDDNKFYQTILKLFIHVRLLASCNKFEKLKTFKKDISKELMPVAWHPTKWWDQCISEDEKKEIDPIFTDKVGK